MKSCFLKRGHRKRLTNNEMKKVEEVKELFTPGIMVSFRSSRTSSSYFVRTKLQKEWSVLLNVINHDI